MNKILALACSVLIAIPALADAATTIDQIAPENSVVVMGVPNAAETMKRIEKTSLWALWQSDEMDEMRTQIMDMINEDMTGILEELGLDELFGHTGDWTRSGCFGEAEPPLEEG